MCAKAGIFIKRIFKNPFFIYRQMRRASFAFLLAIFFVSFMPGGFGYSGYSEMPAFICEIGIKFYQEGRYAEALHEFKKALLAQPDYLPALKYIQMIEQVQIKKEEEKIEVLPAFRPTATTTAGVIKEMLDLIGIQREMIKERQLSGPKIVTPVAGAVEGLIKEVKPGKKVFLPKILTLDESFSQVVQPIEIEQGSSIVVVGRNIQRFLATQPDILTIEKRNPDELLVTGKGIGYTYLHVWDDKGRWTIEFLSEFPRIEGLTYAELARREAERARNFKLRYTLDWTSYETGRRIKTLERSSYSWGHSLNLTGESPYGNIDSTASIRRLKTSTDLTYLTLGLTDGQIGPFKGFNFRSFDYSPYFSNLAFPGATLRGAMLNSPLFNKIFDYTVFWGREGGGRYGNLSPGLTKTKHSFLDGFNLNYAPTTKQNYRFTVAHGWGRDRDDFLNKYAYDLTNNWIFDKWKLGYDIANDSERFVHLFNTQYSGGNFRLNTEFRDVDKSFNSLTGRGWRQGEIGQILSLSYQPIEELNINSTLDVYKDRLYPAEDNDNRLNEDFNWNAYYRIDPLTSINLSYTLQNDLGKLSQYRYQNQGLGINKRFKFFKDIYSFMNYYHAQSENFSSPSSDYISDRVFLGIRFSLIGDLYYYFNKELNWIEDRFLGNHSRPHAYQTGLDWSGPLGRTPLRGSLRFGFRDEENTVSTISFLSGQDYIEGYSELSYRSSDGKEIFGSCRMRNIWADNPSVSKQIEMSFHGGMRYLWDTGVRWEGVGNIEGYVFKDVNSDGLRQRDEPPLQGLKVWLGKDKSLLTDIFGYYKFKGVRARKAYVNLDTSAIPAGYVATVPVTQEVIIAHNRTLRVDFGIVCRTEINGIVFEDIDGNAEFGGPDKAVRDVVVTLEDGKKAVTDGLGRYSFADAPVGEHTITLDLNSLPVYYLPKTAITKKITLFEGVTYINNIPLRRIQE